MQIHDYKEQVISKESYIKRMISNIQSLKEYEKLYNENLEMYEDAKKKIMSEKIIDLSNCQSFPELVSYLYTFILKMKNTSSISKVKFVEEMLFENDSFYIGPVNGNQIPLGAGMLTYRNSPIIKFKGEFENG